MMQVIMIARLHAMYEKSRIMLIFLVITFLAVNIACGAITVIGFEDTVVGKPCLLT
jgi:predicted RND superfamily exporter protein